MEIRVITMAQIRTCPRQSLVPSHWRDDGSCECQPVNTEDHITRGEN